MSNPAYYYDPRHDGHQDWNPCARDCFDNHMDRLEECLGRCVP